LTARCACRRDNAERRLGIIPGGDGIFWRSRQTVPAALKRAGRHGLQHTRHALFVGIEGKSREVIGRGARVEARCGYRHLENPCKIGARILAAVDCLDALASDRPYRPRLSHEVAVRRLRRESGRNLDGDLVTLFVDLIGDAPPERPV